MKVLFYPSNPREPADWARLQYRYVQCTNNTLAIITSDVKIYDYWPCFHESIKPNPYPRFSTWPPSISQHKSRLASSTWTSSKDYGILACLFESKREFNGLFFQNEKHQSSTPESPSSASPKIFLGSASYYCLEFITKLCDHCKKRIKNGVPRNLKASVTLCYLIHCRGGLTSMGTGICKNDFRQSFETIGTLKASAL